MATVYNPDEYKRSRFKKISESYNQLFYYAAALIIFNLILIFLPLVRYFSFEFSVLNSILIVFLSGLYVVNFLRTEETLSSKHERIWYNLFPAAGVFLLIPLLTGVINSLISGGCPVTEGLGFYLLIVPPSVIIGFSLGMMSALLVRKFKLLLFLLIYFLLLISPLHEIYLNPQVYFYNPIIFYFPGTIYDEALAINSKLILYRALNLLYFGIMFILAYRSYFRIGTLSKRAAFFFAVIPAALFIFFSADLGFSTTLSKLNERLNDEVETEHFVIRYQPGMNEQFVKSVALHHEYFYEELKDFLQVEPKQKILSFLFESRRDKKELIGSANADIAKPWLYQIYTAADNYNETLKHEIAHCFSAEFGKGFFKLGDNFNPSLIEGIASASDPLFDENYIDYAAAVAYKNGYRIRIKDLYGYLSFFGNVSTLSYVYAGSFTKFLISNYGLQKFKQLYKDLDFRNVYGIPVEVLSQQFYKYLSGIAADGTGHQANFYFGRKSIFFKVCPRYAANQVNEGWLKYEQGNYLQAGEIFEGLLKVTNSYSAVNGLASSLWEQGKRDESINLLKSRLEGFKKSSDYYLAELRLADMYAQQKKYKDADSIYSELEKQNPSRVFYYITGLRLNLVPHVFPIQDFQAEDSILLSFFSKSNEERFSALKKINSSQYVYNSFPALINSAKSLEAGYSDFLGIFKKTPQVDNYSSAYAIYKLSEYMMENLDFEKARKMAALTLRFKEDKAWPDLYIFQANYKKAEWLLANGSILLNKLILRKGN